MAADLNLEQEEHLRPVWAEAMFLHMRRLRYGISPCKDCRNELLQDAQWQMLKWQREKKIDEALP
jgi:hypothetical protein